MTKQPYKSKFALLVLLLISLLLAACGTLLGTLEVGVEPTKVPDGNEQELVSIETAIPDLSAIGIVQGKVCYPSEIIPKMTAYFQEQGSGEFTTLTIALNQNTYSVELPPGTYIAFAYPDQDPTIGGMYSEATACGLQPECTDHNLRPFVVQAGKVSKEVDLCDWYAQDMLPPRPSSNGSVERSQKMVGLIYRDFASDELKQIGESGELRPLLDQPNARISSDGRQALYELEGDLWIVDMTSGVKQNITNTPDRIESSPQWWPARPGSIIFGSWEISEELGPSTGHLSMISSDGSNYSVLEESASNTLPALSPDGQTIAYDRGGEAWFYNMSGQKEALDLNAYGLTAAKDIHTDSPSWSPDGKQVAWWVGGGLSESGEFSRAVAVFNLETQTVRLLHAYSPLGGGDGMLPAPVWSPDGKWLVVNSLGEEHRADLWVVRAESGEEYNLGWPSWANVAWSPDSRFLAYTSAEEENTKFVEVDVWESQTLDLPSRSVPVDWRDPIQTTLASSEPVFFSPVYFASQPEISQASLSFPADTNQVYAIWSYANMRDGLTVKKEWYRDGDLWLLEEELWDFAHYGANGMIRDVVISNLEEGLEPGSYQLKLFIDGQEQTSLEKAAYFEISQLSDIKPLPSPDGSQVAIVQPPGTLIIQDESGWNTLLTVDEISGLDWFPDGKHIIYSNRNREDQNLDFLDTLWIVNIETGEIIQFSHEAENMHEPHVSPAGDHIAMIGGNGLTYEGGCEKEQDLYIQKIDPQGQITFSYWQHSFEPFTPADDGMYDTNMYVERVLGWESAMQLKVELRWLCSQPELDGEYLFDLATMTAEKVEEDLD